MSAVDLTHWLLVDGLPALLAFVVIAFLGLGLVRLWVRHLIEREFRAGQNRGYLLGRRDERLIASCDSAPGDDARYPLIVETREDGSQRRLDR